MFTQRSLVIWLALAYAFLAPLGNLARIGSGETAFGITTILLPLIAVFALPQTMNAMQQAGAFKALALLISWIVVSSAMAAQPLDALTNGVSLVVYLLAATAAYGCLSNADTMLRFCTALCIGAAIGATGTIVDFMGMVDIPRINEGVIGTQTEDGMLVQATGPFERRSAMAAYYSLAIAMGFLIAATRRDLRSARRALFLFSSGVCMVALMLTHNRAGVLGPAIAIILTLFSSSKSPRRLAKNIALVATIPALLLPVVHTYFPDTLLAYQALLGIGGSTTLDPFQAESDRLRIVLAEHSFASIFDNPLGHGYSLLTGVPGYGSIDPHNILSQIVWAGGLFGAAWLLIFGAIGTVASWRLLRAFQTPEPQRSMSLVLFGTLLGFFIVGMTHNIISTGVAWLILGLLLSLAYARRPAYSAQWRTA